MSAGKQGPPGLRWHQRPPGAFISPVSAHEPPGRATTTAGEAEAQAPRDPEDRRQGAAAPRLRALTLAQPGAAQGFPAWTRDHDGPLRRSPSGLATSARWHLNLGCLRLASRTAAAAQQRARDFGRGAGPLASAAPISRSLATILGNLTDDHRRKIERAPPGTTIPCGEGLIIAVYTQG